VSPPRVLISYDGSGEAARAIRAVAALMPDARAVVAHARGDAVALEHAAPARVAMPDSVIVPSAAAFEREAENASRTIAERALALAEDAGLEATTALCTGSSAWRAICSAGREQRADLIACGTRGAGGVARAFLGSTSSALVHHADRPVLVVPPGAAELTGPVLIGYDGSDAAKAATVPRRGSSRLVRRSSATPGLQPSRARSSARRCSPRPSQRSARSRATWTTCSPSRRPRSPPTEPRSLWKRGSRRVGSWCRPPPAPGARSRRPRATRVQPSSSRVAAGAAPSRRPSWDQCRLDWSTTPTRRS
jgi:nucleotide-binding universal stress UspA family protein